MAYHDITDINLSYVQHPTLQRKLRRHQNQLFERYSKLQMLRADFSYLQDSDSHGQGDIHSTVADITLMLQQSQDINGLVGYAWVLEHTERHGYHIHAAFYLNGQKHRQAWTVFETLRDLWKYVTWEEGHAHRCAPKEHYKVRGEWVTAYDDLRGRKSMEYILSYLSKRAQKSLDVICQLSDIPAAPVAVSDNKLVKRYGIKQADVTAIGCTRQTEAIRRGKWVLHTNDADRAIAYTMGLDGDIPVPGSLVGVADALLAGRPLGGRISVVDGRNITLDRLSSATVGERLIVNLPSGKAEGRTIEAVNDKIITVTTSYSEIPMPESVWAVDATDLALQLYRVIGVEDGDDGVSFDITGIEYDPDKWAKIDTGARIEARPISVIPPSVQPTPTNVMIGSSNKVDQGINITTLRVSWDKADSAIAYEAQWRRDNGNWINASRTSALGFDMAGIYAGQYQARVRAINAAEISSPWANADEMTLTGKVQEDTEQTDSE